MIVRFDSVSVAPRLRAALAAAAAASFMLAGVPGAFAAAPASGTSATGASASGTSATTTEMVGHYMVRRGQSLNDVAVDLAQTKDPATLARVGRALYDANPDAFMKHGANKHDPSRLKIGAVLNVPFVAGVARMMPESGAAAASASGASAPAAAAPGASVPVVSAPAASAPPVAAAPVSGAAIAAASGAMTAAAGSAPTATASAATASAPGGDVAASVPAASAEAAASAATANASASANPGASAAAAAAPSSDGHAWSGAIQAAPANAASAGLAAHPPVTTVSSLQELLALKNRVLMALQQHGIGKAAPTGGTVQPALSPSQGGGAARGATPAAIAGGNGVWLIPVAAGIAGAIVVFLLTLIARSLMRNRKPAPPSDEGSAHLPSGPEDVADQRSEPNVAAATPSRAADSRSAPPAPDAVRAAAALQPEDAATGTEPQADEELDHAADKAGFAAAASLGADALPPTLFESPRTGLPAGDDKPDESGAHDDRHDRAESFARDVAPGEPETLADATDAASLDAAASLGAAALPPESMEVARTEAAEDDLAQHGVDASPAEPVGPDAAVTHAAATPAVEPHEPLLLPEIPQAPSAALEPPAATTAFPEDAVDALDNLDMPLPPRTGEPAATAAPLSTEPVASPESTARQAVPQYEAPAPHAADAITAGTAGAASIAGLGAARFGALSLDFDLNLPPDSAEPLPVFTPGQLAQIARNKLDLAREYIALGDLGGARTLINEVIESNDLATRADAQALLSTLAPLS